MNSSINASNIIIDNQDNKIISKAEAEEAVKTLIRYIADENGNVKVVCEFCKKERIFPS